MNDLQKFLRRVANITRENIKSGTPERIREQIENERKKFGLKKSNEKLALGVVRSELNALKQQFVQERFAAVRDVVFDAVNGTESAISEALVRAVTKGMRNNLSVQELLQNIKHVEKVQERHLNTVLFTTQSMVRRGSVFVEAQEAGINKFKYVGARGGLIRPFCAERVGKVYSFDEIQTMDNGQGLSVLYSCGGYNCRHRWVAVPD